MAKTAFDSLARSVHGESARRDIANQLELSLLMALKVICSRAATSLYKTTRAWSSETKRWLPKSRTKGGGGGEGGGGGGVVVTFCVS